LQNWTPCTAPCVATIPAVSGRVLYYVIDRKLPSGSILSGPLEMVAIQ